MAKTIMISNEVYEELKTAKGENSFSYILKRLLSAKKSKKGLDLKVCLGLLKKDREWEEMESTLKKGWKKWNKKYA